MSHHFQVIRQESVLLLFGEIGLAEARERGICRRESIALTKVLKRTQNSESFTRAVAQSSESNLLLMTIAGRTIAQ